MLEKVGRDPAGASDFHSFFGGLLAPLLIRKDERRSFLIALVLVAFARAQAAFDFTYAVDDYRQIIDGLSSLSGALIGQGRFGTYWLSEVFGLVGFDPVRSPIISIVASVILSAWIGNAVLRLWTYDLPDLIRALLIVIIAAHPYTSEILTFRGIAIYHILAFALSVAAILIAGPGLWRILRSSLLFAVGLTLYQIPINYISVFLCFDLALRAIRHFIKSEDVPASYTLWDRTFYARILTFFVGFALYMVLLKVSTYGYGTDPRGVMIGLGDIPSRVLLGLNLLYGHFVTGGVYGNNLLPKAILAIPLLFVVAALVELVGRASDMRGAIIAGVVVVAAPVVAGFAMLGAPLLFTLLFLPPRILTQIGLVWAGVAVVALTVRVVIPRHVFSASLGLVVFSFIAANNQIFVDQARVATRDHNLAIRLMARLEGLPNFSVMKTIAVVGYPAYSGTSIPTGIPTFNDSNWIYPWAIAPMITELTGIPVKYAKPEGQTAAVEYCRSHQRWPAQDAATIQGELAIVCL
ncbi:glucosyltransferase domain-containing protein [Mesorhizobium sp. AR07]|uniref:glucosyltransferase domain-containing protein n=1 Tax=Mesorhizobium sp. AR07 TaxID=2865838 RepID=UPI00215F38BB|nr:glucosyltransferase domain-containing protein [Mesorhizobium sp. AR07]UVK46802.1 glucosyltransferase domain-containing protein [Mesorhizobium sp. AR07]